MTDTEKLSLFDRIDESNVVQYSLSKGDALFIQGNPTRGLFYLKSGAIGLQRTTESGDSVMIHRAKPVDTFAEASLFCDHFHCTATAVVDSQLIEYKRSSILHLLNTDTAFAFLMVQRFADQMQEARRRIELLSIRSAEERVLAALADKLLVDDIVKFSEVIGFAPETVYRTLGKLSDAGRIQKTDRGQYKLLDVNLTVF